MGMLSTQKHSPQMGFFSRLADQLNQKHPLYLLAHKINWPLFDEAFKKYYSEKMGAPAKPIRLMVSLLILKYVRPFQRLHTAHGAARYAQQTFNPQRIHQHFLQPDHIPNREHGKRHRIGEARRGVNGTRPGSSLTPTQHIRANDEIAVGIESFSRPDHVVPPAWPARFVANAGGMGVARESVGDEYCVRTQVVQLPPCFIGNFNRRKTGPAFERDTVELSQLRFNNHNEVSW